MNAAARSATHARAGEFRIADTDNERLANLCGALDENLRQIEEAFDVRITRRGDLFHLDGSADAVRQARQALGHFLALAAEPLSLEEIQLGLVELKAQGTASRGGGGDGGGNGAGEDPHGGDDSVAADAARTVAAAPAPDLPSRTRRGGIQARTPHQREYLRNILAHDITFGTGPAGTGKTWLAVACAVDAFERDTVRRIVLTRPAVEAGERLGFLPGDLAQKVDPYLRPLYDALYDLLGFERTHRMFEKQAIEIAPLAYMRGRTLNHSFIILDEAQNTTPEQMKMFLTRIGFGSRAVITGDVTQIDLARGQDSGLIEARAILARVRGIAFTEFDSSDVVRHPLVARIVDAYEAAAAHGPQPGQR